jgi:hypothetical protein
LCSLFNGNDEACDEADDEIEGSGIFSI